MKHFFFILKYSSLKYVKLVQRNSPVCYLKKLLPSFFFFYVCVNKHVTRILTVFINKECYVGCCSKDRCLEEGEFTYIYSVILPISEHDLFQMVQVVLNILGMSYRCGPFLVQPLKLFSCTGFRDISQTVYISWAIQGECKEGKK